MIGSREEALTAYHFVWDPDHPRNAKYPTLLVEYSSATEWDDLPEGWEYLGQGCYRAVFRAPSGYVYKVAKARKCSSNDDEFLAFTEHAHEPWSMDVAMYDPPVLLRKREQVDWSTGESQKQYVPMHMDTLAGVICCEYVTGEQPIYWESSGGCQVCNRDCTEATYKRRNGQPLSDLQQAMLCSASQYIADLHEHNFVLVEDGIRVLDAGMYKGSW